MPLLFRQQYTGEISKFDIMIAHRPNETMLGDFMLMTIITLGNNETIPNVHGWTYLAHTYTGVSSVFAFYKICDDETNTFNIIRRKSGSAFVNVYSWYSDTENEIELDNKTILVSKNKKLNKFNKNDYNINYSYQSDKYIIKLLNISFQIFENNTIYQKKLKTPIIVNSNLELDNTLTINWVGEGKYVIESNDGNGWKFITDSPIEETTYQIKNLLPSNKYSFRIYSVEDSIISLPSNEINITTNDRILLRSIVKNLSSTQNPRVIVSPKDIQKGDLMIMQISYSPGVNITKISSGWKLVCEMKKRDMACSIYYKVATRKEPASYIVQHSGYKDKKLLIAIAAFYSLNEKVTVKIAESAIQFRKNRDTVSFPVITSEYDYSLKINMSVREIESKMKLPIDNTLLWDYDKNFRTTAIFKGYNSVGKIESTPIVCNEGSSISATILLFEQEIGDILPPPTPTGFRAKKAEGTTIRLTLL